MEFNTEHPVAYGMDRVQPVVFNRSPAFKIHPSFKDKESAKAVAKYPIFIRH